MKKIRVPEDISTIQLAVDSVVEGGEIIVSPGEYRENINFRGKSIKLRSHNPINKKCRQNTILSGREDGSVIKFINGENRNAVLEGFTIKNGCGTKYSSVLNQEGIHSFKGLVGGGILIYRSSPTVRNNIIIENSSDYGGGIALISANAVIRDNKIINNNSHSGGGIYIRGIIPARTIVLKMIDNIIDENNADRGGGICIEFCESKTELLPEHIKEIEPGVFVKNNNINNNKASEEGGGVNILEIFNVLIENNIISQNIIDGEGALGGAFHIWEADNLSLIKNKIYKNKIINKDYIDEDNKAGAGICVRDSVIVMEDNNVKENIIEGTKKVEANISLYFDAEIRDAEGNRIRRK